MVTILIVDDHSIIRDGIKAMLKDVKDYIIVGEASNGKEAIHSVEQLKPMVVIMDITMPEMNGIYATAHLKISFPDSHVIALTMHDQVDLVREMIRAGALGYLVKNSTREELILAIDSASRNLSYFSREITSGLLESESKKTNMDSVVLTNREKEILRHIAEEFTNSQIAEKLFLSIRTVDTHRRNLLEKLGVKNTAGLVRYAIRNGIITSD
jgi:DNA-binding NarL/FixJ family response regulator